MAPLKIKSLPTSHTNLIQSRCNSIKMKKRIIFLILIVLSIKINAQGINYSNDNYLKSYFYFREGQNKTLRITEIQNIVKIASFRFK